MSSTKNPLHRLFKIDVAAHGDLTGTKFDSNVNLQVIGLGLPRTGTTSLQSALTKLGYGPSHQGVDLFRSPPRLEAFIALDQKLTNRTWQAGDPALTARLRQLMAGYRSTTDNPLCFFADEMWAAYPDAKYILTVRPGGKDEWWRSMAPTAWHSRRDWLRYVFRLLIWPVRMLRRTDDKVQGFQQFCRQRYGAWDADMYDKHNARVQKVIPKDQLLVYDVRDGWEPLCRFLQVPVPNEPFPRLNETGAMQRIYLGMMAFGAAHWLFYAGCASAAAYLVWNPQLVTDIISRSQSFIARTLQDAGLQ